MAIDVNAIEQTVEVTAVGDEINVNIIDQPVLVSVTDQIIEVIASGAIGPVGPGVAAGGTTGQVLSKASNANYDTVWTNAGSGTVYSVDASGSTGISVSGGPITSAGVLTITNTLPDKNYVHDQQIASSSWVIIHNLNKFASVSIVDTANDEIIGDVQFNSLNQVTINFSSQISGKAYIN